MAEQEVQVFTTLMETPYDQQRATGEGGHRPVILQHYTVQQPYRRDHREGQDDQTVRREGPAQLQPTKA